MRAILKIILTALGLTGLLGGALLSMGRFHTAETGQQELEIARLRNLAGTWEARLISVRSAFRDQMLRHGMTAVVEHPSEWAVWRVENKIQTMEGSWTADLVKPRAWVLLRSNGNAHVMVGDSSGLGMALEGFSRSDAPDILIGDMDASRHRFVALQYAPPASDENPFPGQLIALIDATTLFAALDDPPGKWVLMTGPTEAFLASERGTEPPIGAGTWGILLSQPFGMVPLDTGPPIAFCRVRVPGMNPMLVVSEIAPPAGAQSALGAVVLLCAGTAFLVFALRPRRRTPAQAATNPETVAMPEAADDTKNSSETVTFRQIFQALHTPLCVVDGTGRILRVNSTARDLLRLPKGGQPDDSVTVIGADYRGTLREFLAKVTESELVESRWLLSNGRKHFFDGNIKISRLSAFATAGGLTCIEFVEAHDGPPETRSDTNDGGDALDDLNPNPILKVNAEGRVVEANRAALEIVPRLADSPLLYEALPGIEAASVATLLNAASLQRFESLFGSRVHDFLPVTCGADTLLYGLKKSDSQSLQIALHQSQENFNTLCAISSEAILLIDPRSHVITEANLAASELFGAVYPGLVGKNVDDFAEWPWQDEHLRSTVQLLRADNQVLDCTFEHELIKIEGEPTLLLVATRTPFYEQAAQPDAGVGVADHVENRIEEEDTRELAPPAPVALPTGPGMLVVTNPTVRDVARRMLEHLGRGCEVFTSIDDAMVYVIRSNLRPEFVMIDLGDFDQPEDWIEILRSRCGEVPCVGLTDYESANLPTGPNALLNKPFELETLEASLISLDLATTPQL